MISYGPCVNTRQYCLMRGMWGLLAAYSTLGRRGLCSSFCVLSNSFFTFRTTERSCGVYQNQRSRTNVYSAEAYFNKRLDHGNAPAECFGLYLWMTTVCFWLVASIFTICCYLFYKVNGFLANLYLFCLEELCLICQPSFKLCHSIEVQCSTGYYYGVLLKIKTKITPTGVFVFLTTLTQRKIKKQRHKYILEELRKHWLERCAAKLHETIISRFRN